MKAMAVSLMRKAMGVAYQLVNGPPVPALTKAMNVLLMMTHQLVNWPLVPALTMAVNVLLMRKLMMRTHQLVNVMSVLALTVVNNGPWIMTIMSQMMRPSSNLHKIVAYNHNSVHISYINQ